MQRLRAVTLLIGIVSVAPSHADVNEGLAAYKAGDYSKALSELQPPASQGNVAAQKVLARMYAIGQGVKEDDTHAITWWAKAAEAGDAEAQWQLGSEYVGGQRVKRDYTQAVVWYRKAAEQGYAPAQLNLANMLTGAYAPVTENRVEGAHWLQLAAAQNEARAASMLGNWYSSGIGVPHDDTQAVYWWRRAAENGRFEFDAKARLGESYELGRGVAQDYEQAFLWYQKAAVMNRKAKEGLARLYEQGLGGQKNTGQALAIYTDLARSGWQDAQLHLAGLYERGDVAKKNLVVACAWYKVAAMSKPAMASEVRDLIGRTAPVGTLDKLDRAFADDAQDAEANAQRIAKELTPAQSDKAQQLALNGNRAKP